MKSYSQSVFDHYHRDHLLQSMLAALQSDGKDLDKLTCRDLRPFDEFHIRGLKATRELAELAQFKPAMNILDLGSGIGGPARLLAEEFGCRVVGIDLIDSYRKTAAELTRRVRLDNLVSFRQDDLVDLPFENHSFDGAWSLHSIMNTPDLKKAISEIRRVLASGGRYAFYEVFAGDDSPPHFPVPWASSEQSSFLLPTEKFKDLLASAGFQTIAWQDQSSGCLDWFRKRLETVLSSQIPAQPGMELVMGENMIEKSANVVRNLEEQRIRVVMGLAVSP